MYGLLFYVWFIFIIYILTEFWLRQNSLQKIFTHETRNTKLKQQKVLLVSRIYKTEKNTKEHYNTSNITWVTFLTKEHYNTSNITWVTLLTC